MPDGVRPGRGDNQLHVLLTETQWADHLRDVTLTGLKQDPPSTPPVWFYDGIGSDLFTQITELAEYYPTRAERAVFEEHAHEIAKLSEVESLFELGAGSSDKTRLLLAAGLASGTLTRYVPIDCSQDALEEAAERLGAQFPDLQVTSVVADFNSDLPNIGERRRRLVAFLGSTIGNFTDDERRLFLADISEYLMPGDCFLLGTDLVKSPARLVAAYNDAAGVTAEFNLNALNVMNRQLGADFDRTKFSHRAVWNADESRIEMHLVASADQTVTFSNLSDHVITIPAGGWLRTEISVKFQCEQVAEELAEAGLGIVDQWTDPADDFLVTLARK